MKLVQEYNKEFKNWSWIGNQNTLLIDKAVAFLLAMTPILQNYRGIFSASATILMILFPYVTYRIFQKFFITKDYNIKYVLIILPLILFNLYKTVVHGLDITQIGNAGLLCCFFVALAFEIINLRYFVKSAITIAGVASVLIILQYVCYYLMDFHLQLVPTAFLSEAADQWVRLAETGIIDINGNPIAFYRPSAFFLEPSHMFIYTFPCIMILTLRTKIQPLQIELGALLSFGLLYTTSGMGYAFLIGNWGLFCLIAIYCRRKASIKKLFNKKNILWIITSVLIISLFIHAGVLAAAFGRVTNLEAISGRTEETGNVVVNVFDGLGEDGYIENLLFGDPSRTEDSEFYIPALQGVFLDYGVIGLILGFYFYIRVLLGWRLTYLWMSFVIIGLSAFSVHTHGTFYMLFYVMLLFNGYALPRADIKIPTLIRNFFGKNRELPQK